MSKLDGAFTVKEYQEMVESGNMRSGVVELLEAWNKPIEAGVYRRCDGATVVIMGFATYKFAPRPSPEFMYSVDGIWYYVDNGKARSESGFYNLAYPLNITVDQWDAMTQDERNAIVANI